MIQIKRVYDLKDPSDGIRILVDRLWPRGLTKGKAQLDEWMKEIAPSPSLRKSFCHDPAKFNDFKEAYIQELTEDADKINCLEKIETLSRNQPVTLVYGAKDPTINHATVLLDFIQNHFSE